jgi:hypothetical protein
MQTRDVAAARSTRAVADRTMGTGALDRVSSGVLEAQGGTLAGAGPACGANQFSCTLAGVMITGTAGLVALGLMGYWEPGVPFALALIFGFGAAIAWLWDEVR